MNRADPPTAAAAGADPHPVVLFDGLCNLCSGSVDFIIRRDRKGVFRFASLQSEIAQTLLNQSSPAFTDPSRNPKGADGSSLSYKTRPSLDQTTPAASTPPPSSLNVRPQAAAASRASATHQILESSPEAAPCSSSGRKPGEHNQGQQSPEGAAGYSLLRELEVKDPLEHGAPKGRQEHSPSEPSSISPDRFTSLILIEPAGVFKKSTAALRIARRLSFPWKLLYPLILIPSPLRDFLYDQIARNRYRWFGQRATCRLPTPEEATRFLV